MKLDAPSNLYMLLKTTRRMLRLRPIPIASLATNTPRGPPNTVLPTGAVPQEAVSPSAGDGGLPGAPTSWLPPTELLPVLPLVDGNGAAHRSIMSEGDGDGEGGVTGASPLLLPLVSLVPEVLSDTPLNRAAWRRLVLGGRAPDGEDGANA